MISRVDVLKRLVRTMICILAFELTRMLSYFTIFIQYAFLLAAGRPSEQLRDFGNRLSTYAYRLLRYAMLNDNRRPFPFSDLPAENECERQSSNIDFS
ncbi:DUF4389 domain-containing protein [Maridesulfovibrio sp.]|uniref:DUF4389 domain-containing protein n=1 Tax=Maridesulfovibrio sp. TaxID=2795000 RepID=UPI002A18715D|nr:DUF4389 domain-containing protein [Maridesulfovibrio sp.]